MHWIIGAIGTLLLNMVGSLVGRVLLALGFGFTSYVGFNALVDSVMQQAWGVFSGFSGLVLEWAGFFQIDKHLTMVASAITTKIALNGISDGKKFLRPR